MENTELIKYIEENGKSARGKNEFIAHLQGKKLTFKKALLAHCYECNGFFEDGKSDCEMPTCSLYPYMAYNPEKVSSRDMTDEQKKASGDRLKKIRSDRLIALNEG